MIHLAHEGDFVFIQQLFANINYQSDFSLLVIVEAHSSTEQIRLEQKLQDVIEILSDLNTPAKLKRRSFALRFW